MIDYIERIANKLTHDVDVIFYTVGSCTMGCVRELEHRFGLRPSAVCDGDIEKQGRTFKGLCGISVISPDEAISRFPNAEWFIPSLDYRFQIMGDLTEERGVSPERIINYTPVSKVRSCLFLQKALIYDANGIMRFCWRKPCPQIEADDCLDTEALLTLRNNLIGLMRTNKPLDNTACSNCPQIYEAYYPKEPMSWSVNFFGASVCNYNCIYCSVSHNATGSNTGKHTLGEVIDAFKNGGLLSREYSVILSTAGEPLIHPRRKDFYDAFDGFELVVNTNGSIYDEVLFELMEKKRVLLLVSIDAGTRETYAQVKGVDTYEKVKENLKKYSRAPIGMVALKYLFVPGMNDDPINVDGFVDFFVKTNATFAVISIDYHSVNKISEHTRDMISRLKSALSERDILCVPYTAWETAEYVDTMRDLFG